jgi:hypothetical protein
MIKETLKTWHKAKKMSTYVSIARPYNLDKNPKGMRQLKAQERYTTEK